MHPCQMWYNGDVPHSMQHTTDSPAPDRLNWRWNELTSKYVNVMPCVKLLRPLLGKSSCSGALSTTALDALPAAAVAL